MTRNASMLPERVMVLYVPRCAQAYAERLDEQSWLQVLHAAQQVVPGAVQLRPGWCATRARGPARYYGSELQAAQQMLESVTKIRDEAIAQDASVGVASGNFTAQQAARARKGDVGVLTLSPGIHLVEAHNTSEFLSPLPISRIADDQLASMLISLGVRTLGAFAALPEEAVSQRFGRPAMLAHRRARGLGEFASNEVIAGNTRPDLSQQFTFEPPLDTADQLAFACSSTAEAFVRKLVERGLVCTELKVELQDDTGKWHERRWSHPANFTPIDVVNRVRWQAASLPADAERGGAGVATVRFSAAHTAHAAAHEPGLWSTAPDERVHHQLTRVQSLLGHEQLGTEVLLGGRLSTDRQRLLPWGDAPTSLTQDSRPRTGPWPGAITGAPPNIVFAEPFIVALHGATGQQVRIDADDLLNESPARFHASQGPPRAVQAWSAPWPLREGWWRENAVTVFRLQLLLEDGDAWLLRFHTESGWVAEGRYC